MLIFRIFTYVHILYESNNSVIIMNVVILVCELRSYGSKAMDNVILTNIEEEEQLIEFD